MFRKEILIFFSLITLLFLFVQSNAQRPQTPIMGWASWNNFRANISEDIIKAQADAMSSNGMKEAGYIYLNTDDGFYGGRDHKGQIITHPERFPSGMKAVADYIHFKGLKAGIYADAGINTCASFWDKDTIGSGMGLYHHDRPDLEKYLVEWGFDFIKVDWCGGQWLGLDQQVRYTQIGQIIRKIRPDVVFNVCSWKFPGEWVVPLADSWRISGDIDNHFGSILTIIDLNADLWRYASPGHVNDMDMLQIGRGMTYEEDKAHFSMWSMMNSPLLAGNDLTTMSQQTLDILTNQEVIALNQDPLVYQARRFSSKDGVELWAKPLISTMSGEVAVALLNRNTEKASFSFNVKEIGLDASKGYTMRDLWEKTDFKKSQKESVEFTVPPHGVTVVRLKGTSIPFNIFQFE